MCESEYKWPCCVLLREKKSCQWHSHVPLPKNGQKDMCNPIRNHPVAINTVFHVTLTALSRKNTMGEKKRMKQKVIVRKELKEVYNFLAYHKQITKL